MNACRKLAPFFRILKMAPVLPMADGFWIVFADVEPAVWCNREALAYSDAMGCDGEMRVTGGVYKGWKLTDDGAGSLAFGGDFLGNGGCL